MGIHARKPWREVRHIEDRVGSHGGEYWILTLSCGHAVGRSTPRFHLFEVVRGRDGVKRGRFTKPRTAPRRVRCILCPDERPAA